MTRFHTIITMIRVLFMVTLISFDFDYHFEKEEGYQTIF